MRTLAKRKKLQGHVLFILGTFCYCIMFFVPILSTYTFSAFKAPTTIALFLVIVLAFIGFCFLFTKSVYLYADANLLLKGGKLITHKNAGYTLSATEKIIVMLANRILFKAQTNSH